MLSLLLFAQTSVEILKVPENSVYETKTLKNPVDFEKKPKKIYERELAQVNLRINQQCLENSHKLAKNCNSKLSLTTQENENEEIIDVIEVIADQQEYDQKNQIITARGNVEVRFPKGVLRADRVLINIPERLAVAEGQVVLRRGEQILRGERFEYNFFEDRGIIKNASGEIYQPTLGRDFTPPLPNDESIDTIPDQPLGDRLADNQPIRRVTGQEGYQFVLGSVRDFNLLGRDGGLPSTQTGGNVSRLRFQAEKVDFNPQGWTANDIRFTNDPFSPPELEVRANTATFRNISEDIGELTIANSRIVLDQRAEIPILQDRLTVDRRKRSPSQVQFAFDGDERGGLYIERKIELVNTEKLTFAVTPQYLLQKALFPDSFTVENSTDLDKDGGIFNPAVFGFTTKLEAQLAPRTSILATTDLPSLQLSDIDNKLRAKFRVRQTWGDIDRPYLVSFEYNYRERLFNGSLGFQTVQSSVGAVLISPTIPLGGSGINLSYQVGIQNIEAETDQEDLVGNNSDDNLTTLVRFQGAVSLNKGFNLWEGEALPPTAEEGLRYTPVPVRPFLRLNTGITGVTSIYGNGDSQPSLRASVSIQGQIGHFSRPFLDYTGFSLGYSQALRGDASPFLFDRFVDTRTISVGLTQQIYGPIRAGVQASFNLNNNDDISTDYLLEYSRRTHNIYLRYNPVLKIGSIGLRISDFNWSGNPEPFGGSGIQPVIQGITR